jgi:hypothetical protein
MPMSYELLIEKKSDYLHVTVSGENSKENVIAYLAEMREACKKLDCFRVLVEERLEGPRLDVMEVFMIASEGSKRVLGEYDAIAYVDVYAGELLGFSETVAVNRGLPMAAFTSVADAEQWLRQQKDADAQDIFRRDPKT